MPKKKTEVSVVEEVKLVETEKSPELKVTPFSADFGREDLNSLRNKVNEIVDVINSQ